MKRGLNIEAWMINAFIMLLISPVSWSHHWVWVAIAIPVLLYRAITWRHLNWAAGILISILSLWAILVVTVPPKWYWADGINVWDMELVFKLVINDFVWLSVSTMLHSPTYSASCQPKHLLPVNQRSIKAHKSAGADSLLRVSAPALFANSLLFEGELA